MLKGYCRSSKTLIKALVSICDGSLFLFGKPSACLSSYTYIKEENITQELMIMAEQANKSNEATSQVNVHIYYLRG